MGKQPKIPVVIDWCLALYPKQMYPRRRCILNTVILITLTTSAGIFLTIHNKDEAVFDKSDEKETRIINAQSSDSTGTIILRNVSASTKDISERTELIKRFPQFMIIGFGKAGTKALYEALKLHPKLNGPYKEQRFFSLHFSNGILSYLKAMPPAPVGGGYTIEKSPDYIIHQLAPSRILSTVNNLHIDSASLKFIVVLRDPIDRAMSEYLEWDVQRKISGKTRLPPFSKMVLNSNDEIDTSVPYINASCYAYHIKNWLRYFSAKKLCFIDGDRFISNPYVEVHHLEECLGLEHYFTEQNFVYDQNRGFYCFKDNQTNAEPLCMGRNKGRKHPKIPQVVLEKLNKFFQQWNAQLTEIVGHKLHVRIKN